MSALGDQGQKKDTSRVLKATRGSGTKPTSSPEKKAQAKPSGPSTGRKLVARKDAPIPGPNGALPVRVTNHVPTSLDQVQRSSALVFDAGTPFWQKLPAVAMIFIKIGILPFILLKQAVDLALAVLLLGTLLPLALWFAGFIPNSVAIPFLESAGTRGLEALRILGLPM